MLVCYRRMAVFLCFFLLFEIFEGKKKGTQKGRANKQSNPCKMSLRCVFSPCIKKGAERLFFFFVFCFVNNGRSGKEQCVFCYQTIILHCPDLMTLRL